MRSNKTKSSSKRFLLPKKRDKMKKFNPLQEQLNSRNSKRRRPLKNLKPKEWSKSSSLLKLFKRPRLLLPRKPLPRPTLPD